MIRDALARAPKLPQMAERDSIDGFNEGTNNLEVLYFENRFISLINNNFLEYISTEEE